MLKCPENEKHDRFERIIRVCSSEVETYSKDKGCIRIALENGSTTTETIVPFKCAICGASAEGVGQAHE